MARLRNQRFFNLSELNAQISELMLRLNRRPFKKLPGCRESAFVEMDQPALRPLPATRHEFAAWKVATVNINYHVEFDHHYYSVPYRFARQKVDVRATATTVELFHHGQRIASHGRSAIAKRLSEAAPKNAEFARDPAVIYGKLAQNSSGNEKANYWLFPPMSRRLWLFLPKAPKR